MTPVGDRAGEWIIFGAGGHARSVADVLERRGQSISLVVGEADRPWPVRTTTDESSAIAMAVDTGHPVVVAIGDGPARLRLADRLTHAGLDLATVVAATSTVSTWAGLGLGTQVLEHAHVGPGAHVGDVVIVNTGAIIEHDCSVGDGSHLAPGAVLLGGASIGQACFVGSGARVLPGVTVGDGVIIGAGAVVRADVPAGLTVVGVPAHPVGEKR